MKSDNVPDAYFACDTSYMTQVRNLFQSPLTISETDMVIIVQKGNPKNVKTLADLGREGMSIGVANEKQSARLTTVPHFQPSLRATGLPSSNMWGVAIQVLRKSSPRANNNSDRKRK